MAVVIVEQRTTQHVDGSRAGGLHSRTIEVLDQRGIAERFVSVGEKHPALGYAGILLDIGGFPTCHNYVLGLWQSRFEPILADRVNDELGVPIVRGCGVVGSVEGSRSRGMARSVRASRTSGFTTNHSRPAAARLAAAQQRFDQWRLDHTWCPADHCAPAFHRPAIG